MDCDEKGRMKSANTVRDAIKENIGRNVQDKNVKKIFRKAKLALLLKH